VFEVGAEGGVQRAVSEAVNEPLVPDDDGRDDVPGGASGYLVDELVRQIQQLVESE
jgi:hypothetical protein